MHDATDAAATVTGQSHMEANGELAAMQQRPNRAIPSYHAVPCHRPSNCVPHSRHRTLVGKDGDGDRLGLKISAMRTLLSSADIRPPRNIHR